MTTAGRQPESRRRDREGPDCYFEGLRRGVHSFSFPVYETDVMTLSRWTEYIAESIEFAGFLAFHFRAATISASRNCPARIFCSVAPRKGCSRPGIRLY